MQTRRLADPETRASHPLRIEATSSWAASPGGWSTEITLPRLARGTILVPGFTTLRVGAGYHQWRLCAADQEWQLPTVPSDAGPPCRTPTDPRVSTHIDCFHIEADLEGASLRLEVSGDEPPQRYLVTVSGRALEMPGVAPPGRTATLATPPPVQSQMLADPSIARRICSPTSVAMVLEHWRLTRDWQGIVAASRDPATGMYGVWPLALAVAAQYGALGTIEVFTDWQEPLALLDRGIPLVTSIRFAPGDLAGAPLTQTAGHLVVLYGATPEWVYVNDPAAADLGSVKRRYPATAFTRAWLGWRGAAYILTP